MKNTGCIGIIIPPQQPFRPVRPGIKANILFGQADFLDYMGSGPEVMKKFSCSTRLSMKIFLLRNVKMPTIVGILTFMSRKNIQF